MEHGQRQRGTQRAVKPCAEQADEADESGGRAEHQTGQNQNKTQAKHRLATPSLANKVDPCCGCLQVLSMSRPSGLQSSDLLEGS
jgi:hypothetical protein